MRTLSSRRRKAPARASTNWCPHWVVSALPIVSLRDDAWAARSGAVAATSEAREDPVGDDRDHDRDGAARDAAFHFHALHGGKVRQDASLLYSLAVENAKAPLDA